MHAYCLFVSSIRFLQFSPVTREILVLFFISFFYFLVCASLNRLCCDYMVTIYGNITLYIFSKRKKYYFIYLIKEYTSTRAITSNKLNRQMESIIHISWLMLCRKQSWIPTQRHMHLNFYFCIKSSCQKCICNLSCFKFYFLAMYSNLAKYFTYIYVFQYLQK